MPSPWAQIQCLWEEGLRSGLLECPESLQPQLGWFEGERGALSFHPRWEEKKDSFAPQVLLNLPLFLHSSAMPLADTIFVAHRNGAGPHLERNTAAGMASMHLALAQGYNQAGKGPALHGCAGLPLRWGGSLGVQRIGWGQTELSEN